MELLGIEVQLVWLVFPLIGCIAGLLAGLLGLGGGIVLVPGLFFFFSAQGIAPGTEMQFALGTSLACIVPTSFAAAWAHQKQGNIDWQLYRKLVPGFLIGAVIGGLLADRISSGVLEKIFGLLCILVALRIFLGFQPRPVTDQNLHPAMHAGNGVWMGGVAALTGVGGGALVNPYMLWIGYSIRYAIGTAAAAVVAISSFGALTYAFSATHTGLEIPHVGYVVWPAIIAVAIFSMGFARVGARLAERLPTPILKRILGLILGVVGFKFIL